MLGQIIGAGIGAAANIWNNNKQTKIQKQFAQQGIQWKVADAKKAGIHPLAALGAQTTAYSPQSLQLGSTLSDAGQSVDNAIHRSTDHQTRVMGELQLEKAGLENEYLRAQILSIRNNRTGMPPALMSNRRPTGPTASLRSGEAGTLPTDLTIDDAQTFENRYGESSDYIEGPMNRFYDAVRQRQGMPWFAYRDLQIQRLRDWYAHGRNAGTRLYRHQ